MVSLLSLAVGLNLLFLCINQCEGCINGLSWRRKRKRRKRDIGGGNVNRLEYFTQCMIDETPSSFDWQTIVGYGIEDSIWYQVTNGMTDCQVGGDLEDGKDCWIESVEEQFNPGATRSALIACIEDFVEDSTAHPDQNQHPTPSSGRRKKRSSENTPVHIFQFTKQQICSPDESPESLKRTFGTAFRSSPNPRNQHRQGFSAYVDCLNERSSRSKRRRFNFASLANFIRSGAIKETCNLRRFSHFSGVETWPYQLILLTGSRLRRPLETCAVRSYPPNARWSSWKSWTSCSVTCGVGTQTRKRGCLFVTSPQQARRGCPGEYIDSRRCRKYSSQCNTYSWGPWTPYFTCTKSCGGGHQVRTRQCLLNREIKTSAKNCRKLRGKSRDFRSCNTLSCPTPAPPPSWSNWSGFTQCSVRYFSCGQGTRTKSRRCLLGYSQVSSRLCRGVDTETQTCSVRCRQEVRSNQ